MSFSQKLTDLRRVLSESQFLDALCLERKRAERSRQRFVLMVLDIATPVRPATSLDNPLDRAALAVLRSIRETDIIGWHRQQSALAVIFAELGMADKDIVLAALQAKVRRVLHSVLSAEQIKRITMTFCCFPEDPRPDELTPLVNAAER
jgi:hypothetical protein